MEGLNQCFTFSENYVKLRVYFRAGGSVPVLAECF